MSAMEDSSVIMNGNSSNGSLPPSVPAVTPHVTPVPKFSETRSKVKQMRRVFGGLFVKIPTSVKFRKISDNVTRIYFLLCPGQGKEATLYSCDFDADAVSTI